MTGRHAGPLALALCVLVCGPPSARAEDPEALKAEAIQRYKQKDYPGAIERLERAHVLAPDDHELFRLLGSCQAMAGNREEAYRSYLRYVEACPDCMYTPTLRENLRQYEEQEGLPPTQPPREAKPVSQPPPDRSRPPARLTSRAEILAGRLLANASTIRRKNPQGAAANCVEVLKLMPLGHALHAEARALYTELTGQPPPALSAPVPVPTSEDSPERQAKKLYEEAYVVKGTNPELARRKLEQVLRLVPESDIYHHKATRLLERL